MWFLLNILTPNFPTCDWYREQNKIQI